MVAALKAGMLELSRRIRIPGALGDRHISFIRYLVLIQETA
jgi:hypothetical protein